MGLIALAGALIFGAHEPGFAQQPGPTPTPPGATSLPQVPASPPPPAGPAAPSGYVLVQYAAPSVRAQGDPDAPPPTMEEQGFRQLAVPPDKTQDEFLAELRADPAVISAQPSARVYAAELPDDPYYFESQAAYMNLINAPAGWDLQNASGDVIVAVLDSGVDIRHPEFAGHLWENNADADHDGVDDDGNGCIDDRYGCRFVSVTAENAAGCGYTDSIPRGNILDDHGRPGTDNSHGTLVAGIIGAAGNNNAGIAGASWNVKILPVKVLDCGPFGGLPQGEMGDVIQGINYAVRMGAKIINISIASAPGDQTADSPALRQAIADAQRQGVIIVAAAGNHSTATNPVGPGYPAAYTQYDNVVAVGASTLAGTWASYSDSGPALDLAAPGFPIAGPVRTDVGFDPPYGTAPQGTSFATPLVSGLFALLRAKNPSLTASEYVDIAKAGASPAPPAPHGQNWAGAGIVNYGNALARVPALVSGNALHDWKDVPAGTEVHAVIDGHECGSATTFALGPATRYELRVRADGEQAGCGAPGRTVVVTIGGQSAEPTIAWAAKNQSLSYPGRNVSTISPPPGDIVVQTLNGSWSNIAHLGASGPLPGVLDGLSSSWDAVLQWDPAKQFLLSNGAYRRFYNDAPEYVNDLGGLDRYEAYWIDAAPGNFATLNPRPAPGRTIQLQAGWNNFVWTGSAAEAGPALSALDGKYLQVLNYDNATQTWLSFIPGQPRYLQGFNGLFQFKVYWIYMTAPATLVMP